MPTSRFNVSRRFFMGASVLAAAGVGSLVSYANLPICFGLATQTEAWVAEVEGAVCYTGCWPWHSCSGPRTWYGQGTTVVKKTFCERQSVVTKDQNQNLVCEPGGRLGWFGRNIEECQPGTTTCPP